MNTTHLFVELIIIGIGTAICLFLSLCCFMDVDFALIRAWLKDAQVLWAALAIPPIYVLGILTDRFADTLFNRATGKIRSKVYKTSEGVLADKVIIYQKASPLVDMINYGRSRMRICRGWTVNMVGIALFSNIALAQSNSPRLLQFVVLNTILLLSFAGALFAWKDLTFREYDKIKNVSEKLRNDNSE